MGDIGFGEMILIVLVIVVLFGPDKLPQIARDLGQGVRKMRGAMEDIKTEILKETDNPVAEIKREIDKVKDAAKEYDPTQQIKKEFDVLAHGPKKTNDDQLNDSYEGPVSR